MHANIHNPNVQDTNNVTYANGAGDTTDAGHAVVRANIAWPSGVWKQIRMIALERGIPPSKVVIDTVVEHLKLKVA
jgi:hypothetical protein